MKRGNKHKTSVFGDDSERYASSLYQMIKNPNGTRRPDLISLPNFDPRLSIELKSGRHFKGCLVAYQLHYAVTTARDYKEVLGEELPEREGLLPGTDWETISPTLPQGAVAYYYGVMNRTDKVTSADLTNKWSPIKLRWGDQCIVPNEFGFCSLATEYARKTGEEIDDVIKYLREIIREDVLTQNCHAEERKQDRNCWQNLNGKDIISLFHQDPKLTTPLGRQRNDAIRIQYPQLDDLKRIAIPGPNETTIHILAKTEHENLFDKQFRGVIGRRKPAIEEVTRGREEAESLLEKIAPSQIGKDLHGNPIFGSSSANKLSTEEKYRLDRLKHWVGKDELTVAESVLEYSREADGDKEDDDQDEPTREELDVVPFEVY